MIEAKSLIATTELSDEYGMAAELVSKQLSERPAWQENNVTGEILELFAEEVEEMEVWWSKDLEKLTFIESDVDGEKKIDFITKGVTKEQKEEEDMILLNFLAEVGDLGYFASTYFEVGGEQLPSRVIEILRNADEYVKWRTRGQYDLAKCTLMKVRRNEGKYHKKFLQETGKYEESSKEAKKNWQNLGGDDWFLPKDHYTFNGVDRSAEKALWEDGDWWHEMGGDTDDFLLYYSTYNAIEFPELSTSVFQGIENRVYRVASEVRRVYRKVVGILEVQYE